MFNRVKCRETNFAGTNASVSLATGVSAIKELGDTSVNSWVFETKNERRVAFFITSRLSRTSSAFLFASVPPSPLGKACGGPGHRNLRVSPPLLCLLLSSKRVL